MEVAEEIGISQAQVSRLEKPHFRPQAALLEGRRPTNEKAPQREKLERAALVFLAVCLFPLFLGFADGSQEF